MSNVIDVPTFLTVTLGFAVYIIGAGLNTRIGVLRRFNIPEPVTGGLLASFICLVLYSAFDLEFAFHLEARDILLVIFFAGIGLNARFADLIAGGKPLLILLGLTLATIFCQNLIGTIGAVLFGYPAQIGVLFGSAALIGGHGTAIAWSPAVSEATGVAGTTELGVAVATLGLVIAALIGGPVAKVLIERHDLTPDRAEEELTIGVSISESAPEPQIDHLSLMRVLLYLNLSVILGYMLNQVIAGLGLNLPLFVPCLIVAIVIANLRAAFFPNAAPVSRTQTLGLVSEFALGAFLAMTLMSLQLWTIAALGAAIAVILTAQTLFAIVFIFLVLFPLMGGGYRAAVLSAGFGGFALGATPTAIANMTAVTKRYGPSPIAFIILPLVSAFFVDLANAVVIQTIVSF